MRPRKGSGAERLGIKFTGNPDAREYREQPVNDCETGIPRSILDNPGKYLIGSLSGDGDLAKFLSLEKNFGKSPPERWGF